MATISVEPEVSRERVVEWVRRFVRYPSEWSERIEESPAVLIPGYVPGEKTVFLNTLVQRYVLHESHGLDTRHPRNPVHEVQV